MAIKLLALFCNEWSELNVNYNSNPQEEPLCTVLSNNHNFHMTGKWYDEKCSESSYGFVCQKLQGEIHLVSLYSYSIQYLNCWFAFGSLLARTFLVTSRVLFLS